MYTIDQLNDSHLSIVVHIETIEEYLKLKPYITLNISNYKPSYKYYLMRGGFSEISHFYQNNSYKLIEFNQIKFSEELQYEIY